MADHEGTTLVTGASGNLGRALVAGLRARGRVVAEAGRKGPVVLDLLDGTGLPDALNGVTTVLHSATDPFGDTRKMDVAGTERLLAACKKAGVRHFVYPSIVGIARVPTAYYRAKVEAEGVVAQGGVPWTVLPITQFHGFVDVMLGMLHRSPIVPVFPSVVLQPIDVVAAAEALVDVAVGQPRGRDEDLGGPEVLDMGTLVDGWQVHRRRRLKVPLPLPRIGAVLRAVTDGALTCPNGKRAGGRYLDWLAAHPR